MDLITDWMVSCGGLGLYLDLLLLQFDYILVLGLGVCLFVAWVGGWVCFNSLMVLLTCW